MLKPTQDMDLKNTIRLAIKPHAHEVISLSKNRYFIGNANMELVLNNIIDIIEKLGYHKD